MSQGCLLPYRGEGYFQASVSEPVSCIVGAFKTSYHFEPGEYDHQMGIRVGGKMAILAGAGPMGLSAIDYAIHGPMRPGLLVITDIDDARLARAASWLTPEHAREQGVHLHYINTATPEGLAQVGELAGASGYDDVHVFAPVRALVEQAGTLLGFNGCLNFFAGPSTPDFSATLNLYDIHYSGHHIVGSSGGNTQDLREALDLMARGVITPALMVTHVGGITAARGTTLNLPDVPGGKKLIYTQLDLPLFALDDLASLAEQDDFYRPLAEMTASHNGLWSLEAETYLLANAPSASVNGGGA
jgi:threonine dehydrogenase-like Zn-dependent dehydrogenase